jgi:hypothetical protein
VDVQGVVNVGSVHVQQHTQLDAEVQLHRLVNETFATYDRLQQVPKEQVPTPESENLEEIKINNTPPKSLGPIDVLMEGLISKASTPLFEGSSTSILSIILVLLNSRTMHYVSNVSMDEFFLLLRKELLPKINKMPKSSYEANKLIKSLGLNNDSFHACEKGCVLSWGSLKQL